MSETINLNRARKAKAVIDARSTAVQNRIRFGRSKTAKTSEAQKRDKAERYLDGTRRDP